MKIRQIQCPSIADLQALTECPDISPHWVLVFGDKTFFTTASLATLLQKTFPKAVITGCSTSGEILGDKTYTASCAITLIEFEDSTIKAVTTELLTMEDSYDAGARLAQALPREQLSSVILLGTGVAINGSALVKGIQHQLGTSIPLSGGLAGDSGAFTQTWTLGPAGVSDKHLVAIGLYGSSIQLSYGTFAGWEAFGPTRKITRFEQNILYELDNEPALAIYKRYLGEYAAGLPGSGLLFPFEMFSNNKQTSGIFRTILGIDEEQQSLILAGDIEADGYMRLMHASVDKLVNGAEKAALHALGENSQTTADALAILVSCVGRKLVMGDRLDEEVEAVADTLGKYTYLTGFYSNGEIAGTEFLAECKLHNQTMTITWIREH